MDEDLGGGHRAKRQPTGGDEDAENVAKVGRRYHFDIFDAALMLAFGILQSNVCANAESGQERCLRISMSDPASNDAVDDDGELF